MYFMTRLYRLNGGRALSGGVWGALGGERSGAERGWAAAWVAAWTLLIIAKVERDTGP